VARVGAEQRLATGSRTLDERSLLDAFGYHGACQSTSAMLI